MITEFFGDGDKRDRTADLLNAIQTLSQLSYTPILMLTVPISRVLSRVVICLCWTLPYSSGAKRRATVGHASGKRLDHLRCCFG